MQAVGDVSVTIESQNMQDTMMHTSSVLYEGSADGASFTVPEDSMVVYFNFSADQTTALESAAYQGEAGSGSVPLGYKLLPGFIAGMLCAVVATLLDKAPAKEITDIYDKATMLLKED